ncbi:hypothetical protein SAMN05216276_101482 [Streptosporangium subroseum]|uniref:Uncharacterized protein n=1 Tax=Streptosporangium subroseum TaxID=106412 RepID=A0A239GRQ0_9ACTN|nr:hypothetical protein [Streptosporangium subroseum]SNS70754.1 hypothetical protein SAMN05216276_101482 [Streptosporangium subroseum]
MLLVTVRLPPGATLAQAMRHLGLSEKEVDTGYGLVLIDRVDPGQSLYGLRVSEAAARRIDPAAGEGPYSDPRIEPYGPPS